MLVRLVKRARNEQGFTLIELLVVVAIIGLLTTLAMPKVFEAVNKAKITKNQAALYQISQAIERYYFDQGTYPGGAALDFDALHTDLADYLRQSVAGLTNDFGQKVMYFGTTTGDGYILVDPQGLDTVTVVGCDPTDATNTVVWDVTAGTLDVFGAGANPADAKGDFTDLSGCALEANSKATLLGYN